MTIDATRATAGLTAFAAPRERDARAALERGLASWLGIDASWALAVERAPVRRPTPVSLHAPSGEALRMLFHHAPPRGWALGPIGVTFERPASGEPRDPAIRDMLRRLHASVTEASAAAFERGIDLHRLHREWSLLASVDDRFYRHVEAAHSGVTGLLRAGFRCNQDCHFCWQGRDWPAPPDELVFRWLEELADQGVTRLTICGGEPTLWRALPDLIERASRVHGMRVHMNTNAIRLRRPEYASRLREAGLETILVSLHSADPDVSDRMTRAPGTHARTVEGIRAALDAGILVVVNCVVERENVETLADHARFIRRELVDGRAGNRVEMVNYSQPGRYHDEEAYPASIVPLDEARPHLVAAARILHEAGVLLEITGSCGFPSCVASEIPHVAPWRPASSFDAQHASARGHSLDACARCSVRDQCIGVRHEYAAVHGERGLVPFQSVPTSDWYERLSRSSLGASWSLAEVAK